MLKIVQTPNKVLHTPVKEIKIIDARIKKIVQQMEETLVAQVDPQGVGLAAPQVGLSLALFIIKPTPKARTETYINPKIIASTPIKEKDVKKGDKIKMEGCLSIYNVWAPVARSQDVTLSYLDLLGRPHEKEFKGFHAVIVQHEMDHLQGVLFTARALEQGQDFYEEVKGELVKKKGI